MQDTKYERHNGINPRNTPMCTQMEQLGQIQFIQSSMNESFEDFSSCVTVLWSNGQVDKSRGATEGPLLEIQELGR